MQYMWFGSPISIMVCLSTLSDGNLYCKYIFILFLCCFFQSKVIWVINVMSWLLTKHICRFFSGLNLTLLIWAFVYFVFYLQILLVFLVFFFFKMAIQSHNNYKPQNTQIQSTAIPPINHPSLMSSPRVPLILFFFKKEKGIKNGRRRKGRWKRMIC